LICYLIQLNYSYLSDFIVSNLDALIAGNNDTKQVEIIEQIEIKKIDLKSSSYGIVLKK
tara:strand:+ start:1238 stop:1414 length:177 start_codon:yes stop_codon:yes gene_type:complete